jgi:hypothetical protein
MESRASKFVEQFKKPVELMMKNIDWKEMSVFVIVYARDKLAKDIDEDWDMKYAILSQMWRYDWEVVRNIIESNITRMEIWI